MTVVAVDTGSVVNVARVDAPGDVDRSNNRDEQPTDIGTDPDVAIDKRHDDPFQRGRSGVFTIEVTNVGPVRTTGPLVVTDTLPTGLSRPRFVQGPGWAFTVLDVDRFRASYRAALNPGESAEFQFSVRVSEDADSVLINRAWVSTLDDADSTNNVDADTVRIPLDTIDVALEKDTLGDFQSGTGQFRFTVENVGPDTTLGPITLADTLPDGLTPTGAAGSLWTVHWTGQLVTAVYAGTLSPGESSTFVLDVNVADGFCGTNSGTITTLGDPPDGPRGANNTDTASVCIERSELTLRKEVTPKVAAIGDQVVYTLVVGAPGRTASDVQVTDQLPPGFGYVQGTTRIDGRSADDPSGPATGPLTFRLASVLAGDSVRITYRVLIGPGAELGDGINRAVATSPDTPDMPRDSAQVEIERGFFTDEGIIVGKVFWDCHCAPEPGDQDPRSSGVPEIGIPGVRIVLQDGTTAITDSEGNYSFYGLSPRTWIVKVDRSTLPTGARLVPLTNRHANDGSTAFVDLKSGELHRADFADGSSSRDVHRRVMERRDRMIRQEVVLLPADPVAPALAGTERIGGFAPLLPDHLLTDLNSRLPAAPGRQEVRDEGGLPSPAPQPGTQPQSDEIAIDIGPGSRADGVTPVPVTIRLASDYGHVTLEASDSYWMVRPAGSDTLVRPDDLSGTEPGLQVSIPDTGSTLYLIAPDQPSTVVVRASLDAERTRAERVVFGPMLRPLLAAGLLEARLDLRSLTDGELGFARDRFEDELRAFATESDDGDVTAGARAALFLQGGLDIDADEELETQLTLRVDSEEDPRSRFFRDIQPDRYYPVYGDASARGFEAQSMGRVFGELARGASFLRFGDFNTGLGNFGQTGARALGQYARTMNGALQHYESDRLLVDAFASRDRLSQVVDEIPGQGISGPYALSRSDGLLGSERVELVTRDRDQPSVVVRSEVLERFRDYTIEPFSGRIVFRNPIPNVDSEFNPITIRVSYEVENGGEDAWVFGANGQVRPIDRFEIGGGFVRDDNPLASFDLASINATIALRPGSTYLVGEFARADSADAVSGDAGRVELRHASERFDGRLFYLGTDRSFRNPSSAFLRGREELGFRAVARDTEGLTSVFAEYLRSENRFTQGTRTGGRIALERAFGEWMRAQVGYRRAEDDGRFVPNRSNADAVNAIGARITGRLPNLPRGSVFGEFEQDLSDTERRRALLGADYRILERARIYGRHEFISSLTGPYGLDPEQEQNNTIFGIAADYLDGQSVFSEYRGRDSFGGRDAQAAIGLRNRWSLSDGVRVSTSLERLSPLSTGSETATAVTGALELTANPDWKATMRAEYYARDGSDNLFGSLGYARKLNSDLTFLGSTIFSTLLDGDRAFERTRLGVAYRETERNRWNALARYEHSYEQTPAEVSGVPTTRAAHVFSAHLNFQPDPDVIFRGGWSAKSARLDRDGLSTDEAAHLLFGRGTFDVTDRLDIGVIGRALLSGSAASRYGIGAEVGVLVGDNLRLAGGYNAFGFTDAEFSREQPTDRGFYVQLGFKFDESLFDGSEPFRGDTTVPDCWCDGGGPIADVVVDIDGGPPTALADDLIPYPVRTWNQGDTVARDVTTSVVLPPNVEVRLPSAKRLADTNDVRRDGDTITWALGDLPPGDTALRILEVRPCRNPIPVVDTLLVPAVANTPSSESDTTNNHDRSDRTVVECHGPPPRTDLVLTVIPPDTIVLGEPFSFVVTTHNEGSRSALNVADVIDGGRQWPPDSIVSEPVDDIDTLTVGGVHSHTLWFSVPQCVEAPTAEIRTFRVGGVVRTTTVETRTDNNADTETVSVEVPRCEGPDLAIRILPDSARTGSEPAYAVTTWNEGTTSEDAVVRVTLPPQVTLVDATGSFRTSGSQIIWPSRPLQPGDTIVDHIVVRCETGTFTIRAAVDTVPGEVDTADNRSATTTTTRCTDPPLRPDLRVEVRPPTDVSPGDTVQSGTELAFEVVVVNDTLRTGAREALNVRDSSTVDHSPSNEGRASLVSNLSPGREIVRETEGWFRWSDTLLTAGAAVPTTMSVAVSAPAACSPEPVERRVRVIGATDVQQREFDARNNVDTAEVTVFVMPDAKPADLCDSTVDLPRDSMDISVEIGPERLVAAPGDTVLFEIWTRNVHDSTPARGVELWVPRPDGTEYRPMPAGPLARWRQAFINGRDGADTVRWIAPIDLVVGDSVRDSLALFVDGSADSFAVVAHVSTIDPETDYTNNVDTAWVWVDAAPVPDLVVDLVPVTIDGCFVDFRVTATNIGLARADSVRIAVALPPGVEPHDHTAEHEGDSLIWWAPFPSLDRLERRTETFRLEFPTGPDTLQVVAVTSTSTPERTTQNNRDTTVVIIQDTITLESCCQATCSFCLPWPWPWWVWLLPLIPIIPWLLYRRRRYGRIFAPCFQLWTIFRRRSIREFVAELRDPANTPYDSVRRIHNRIGGQPCMDWELTEELMHGYRDVRSWTQIYALYHGAPPALKKNVKIRRLYAFALNRDGRREDAEYELRKIIDEKGPDAHTCGILGRVYKDHWEDAYLCYVSNDCGDGKESSEDGGPPTSTPEDQGQDDDRRRAKERMQRLLALAIATYREGHEAEPENPYPGLNALTLAQFLDEKPSWFDGLIEEVTGAAKAWTGDWEYWTHATRAELAVLQGDQRGADEWIARALETRHVPWEVKTTARNLRLIATAWTRDDSAPPSWLSAMIARLDRIVEEAEETSGSVGDL